VTATELPGHVDLGPHGIDVAGAIYRNPTTALLYTHALARREGRIADGGALAVDTGKHTGRSPKDKFVVAEPSSEDRIWWGDVNQKLSEEHFDGLRVTFAGGRVTDLESSTAQDTMRTIIARDEGAARLGEVALVDGEGRIGALDTVFYDTLLDENAASHIALGRGFAFLADDEATGERLTQSDIHIDFMIGSPELRISGITREGEEVPVLSDGRWRI